MTVVSENTLAKYKFGSVGLLLKNFEIKIAVLYPRPWFLATIKNTSRP